jgi:hypothetical protein
LPVDGQSGYDVQQQLQDVVQHPPKTAWLVRCVAEKIVADGFDIPIYVIHAPHGIRYQRMMSQFAVSCPIKLP